MLHRGGADPRPESVKDEFIETLVERTEALRVGDPQTRRPDMGPLCHRRRLPETVERVEDAGAKARGSFGGEHDDRFHEPTILTEVRSEMTIADEETFGPVAPIMTFGTSTRRSPSRTRRDYGLTGAVFTTIAHDAWRAAEELDHGTVHQRDDQLLGPARAVRWGEEQRPAASSRAG